MFLKNHRLLIVALINLIAGCSSNTNETKSTVESPSKGNYLQYPDYDHVVSRFFSKYSIKNIPYTARIEFEKRPTGWHVAVIDYLEEQKTIKNELFWENEKGKFKMIDFDTLKVNEENPKDIRFYENDRLKQYYRFIPYYGYPGWYMDVIQELENNPNLPDSTLYALGRAYSSRASSLLSNQYGFADKNQQFELPNGKNCMSKKQLDKYRYYRHQAIERLNQLAELNPKFKTIVGPIEVKASNEYLLSFLDLRIYQNEEEASKEIIKGLYPDLYIAEAKNYLNSCSKNAILFTNGDNDTYPLLYVQSKYGYRTDVLVVNLSLLNTERYTNSLRETIIDAPGLPLSIPAEKLAAGKLDFVRYFEAPNVNVNSFYPLDQVLEYVTSDDPKLKQRTSTNELINVFPVKKFSVKVDKKAAIASGDIPAKDTARIVDQLEWAINKSFLTRAELVVLDIIATNAKAGWKRPIYWTTTTGSSVYMNLDKYFRHNGLTYQLLPVEANKQMRGMDDMDLLYNRLMKDYKWGNMEKGTMFLDDKAQLVPTTWHYLRSLFIQVADYYANTGKPDTAAALVDKCYASMPETLLPMNLRLKAASADIYYKTNQMEKGDQFLKEVGDNSYELIQYYKKFRTTDELKENMQILQSMGLLAREYKRDKLADTYDNLYKQVTTLQ